MHFCYSVTKDQYLQMLEHLLQKKEHAPFRVLSFLLLTVGQSIWVVSMLSSDLTTKGKVFLVVWSCILTAINVIYRCTRKRRAKTALENLIKTEQIKPDYWKPHHLTIEGNLAKLKYGKTELECPCTELEIIDEPDLVYLYSHNIIFDLVPSDITRKDELLQTIYDGQKSLRDEVINNLDSADYCFQFTMSGKEFKKTQIRIYQSFFTTRTLKSPRYIISIVISVFLCYYMTITDFSIRWFLCLAVILYLHFPAVLCITPITNRYLKTKIPEFQWITDHKTYSALFLVKRNLAVFAFGDMNWQYALNQIEFVFSKRYGVALFTGKWPAGFIPSSQFVNRFRQDEFIGVLYNPGRFSNTATPGAESSP